jgi:hypothetical protein
MNLKDESAKVYGVERRKDGPVDEIDEAVVIAAVAGVGPAIDHMSEAGVQRETALRVLASPEHHREVKSETLLKVLRFLGMRP